jgi:hypothetical protein
MAAVVEEGFKDQHDINWMIFVSIGQEVPLFKCIVNKALHFDPCHRASTTEMVQVVNAGVSLYPNEVKFRDIPPLRAGGGVRVWSAGNDGERDAFLSVLDHRWWRSTRRVAVVSGPPHGPTDETSLSDVDDWVAKRYKYVSSLRDHNSLLPWLLRLSSSEAKSLSCRLMMPV